MIHLNRTTLNIDILKHQYVLYYHPSGNLNLHKLSNFKCFSLYPNDYKPCGCGSPINASRVSDFQINTILLLNPDELKQAYQIHLNKCKTILTKRLSIIPINTIDYNIWDNFMQISMNNISLHIIQYLDSWNDILSLLCCSKTTHNSVNTQLIIEFKNNSSFKHRTYNFYHISKRDPNTFSLIYSKMHSDYENDICDNIYNKW